MSTFEETLRSIIREELSEQGKSVKTRLYALAQEIVNEVKPGETVREVLINTNSAEPIMDVIEQAKEIIENFKKNQAKKTVFSVMFVGTVSGIRLSKEITEQFDDLNSAIKAIEKVEGKKLTLEYFVLQHEVNV